MLTVYRVLMESAPTIDILSTRLPELDGAPVSGLLPVEGAFRGLASSPAAWNQFYRVGIEGLAISEEAWEHCMGLYYLLEYGDVEIPWILTEQGSFRMINPLQTLEKISDETLQKANKLFRVTSFGGQVFCVSGTAVPGDEFKFIDDQFGFEGLKFEVFWRSEE